MRRAATQALLAAAFCGGNNALQVGLEHKPGRERRWVAEFDHRLGVRRRACGLVLRSDKSIAKVDVCKTAANLNRLRFVLPSRVYDLPELTNTLVPILRIFQYHIGCPL
jgi:hypothetical protein